MKHVFFSLLSILMFHHGYSQSGIPFLTHQDNFCTAAGTFQGNWQLIGPKSFSTIVNSHNQYMGRIDPVWVDPDDSSHILAGSLSGGLFEKIPGTMTWRPLTDKLPGIGVHDIAVHKYGTQWSDAAIVISTSTEVNDPERKYGLGIYYSPDGGQHWTFDQQFYDSVGRGIPRVNRTRFMYGTDGLISIVNHKILRKSSLGNPLAAWEDITPAAMPANCDLFDLEMSPSDSNVFWVAGGNAPGATTGAALFYTLDGGDSFTNLTSSCTGATFFNLALPRNDHAFVYYYTSSTARIRHFALTGTQYVKADSTTPGQQGNWFDMSPLGTLDTVYFGRSGGADFLYSFHRGSAGTVYASTSLHVDVRYICVAPVSGHVYVGNDGGVSKSSDHGKTGTWRNLNGTGLAVSQVYGLSGVEEQPGLLFGGAQDNHTWRLENGVPSLVYTAGDGYETESFRQTIAPFNVIFFHQVGDGVSGPSATDIYRKTDGGPITDKGKNVTPDSNAVQEKFSKPIYYSGQSGRFYAAQNDLWICDNIEATNPIYVPAGLNGSSFNNGENAVSAFDVSPLDENRIYVAYNASGDWQGNQQYNKQLFYNDPQFNWQNRTPSLISNPVDSICSDYLACYQQITGVVSDPKNYNRVWITLSDRWTNFETDAGGNLKPYKESGVYYSDSAGLPGTWHNVSTGLPNFYIHCIAYQHGTDDVLYVGTDAGVFRWNHNGPNAWDGSWQCFSSGMPACVVKDLEINYCAGKLRAATYGRGFWESDLYPQTLATPRTQNTATWSSDRKEIQSFAIPSGQILTIANCTVNMAANTYIKVQPGGKLILDGATLTNSCGYMWSGIQVLGDPTKKQSPTSNQGMLIMKNGAKIENAYVAAMADEANYSAPDYTYPNGKSNGDGVDEHGGGIIQVQFSETNPDSVTNCRKGISFGPYHSPLVSGVEPANKSYIYGCVFRNTGYLNPPYQDAYSMDFISMWNVHGIGISGNKFFGPTGVNQSVSQVKAITSTDADYIVGDYCISQNLPCTDVQHTEFHDLFRGVYSVVADPGAAARLLQVSNCTFDNVRRSVYLSGHQNADVIFNTINLNQTSNDTSYGIYTNGCTFYTIEENTISGAASIRPFSYGIIINNSVSAGNVNDDNLVYKNFLNNLQYGTVSMQRNANTTTGPESGFHGLEFRCNEYHNVKYSIAAFPIPNSNQKATLKFAQGSSSDPAGNYFELNTGQYSLFKQQIPDPIYYYHNLANYNPTNYLYSHFTPSATTITTVSCPSHFGGGGGEQRMEAYSPAEAKQEIRAYLAAADSLLGFIDAGNTAQLVTLANDVNVTSADLKTNLLSAGPYLSDTVLNTSLARSNPMKNSDTKEVILNNSPVTDTVYSVLEEEKPVVAENAVVINAQEGVSERSNLLADAGGLYLQAHMALHDLRDYYEENDSVNAFYQYLVEQQRNP